jgi:hypothetical protein
LAQTAAASRILTLLLLATPAFAADVWSWWVEPCTPVTAKRTACRAADTELAEWAFKAWQRESNGAIVLEKAPDERSARVRIHWAGGADGLYGEAQPILVDGKRGASIYVLPDANGLGRDIAAESSKDDLFRDTIVYLTCLHESGHAFGLAHTSNFADIMYTFQYGGDIVEYFMRYRRALHKRADIASNSGISPFDRQRVGQALSPVDR